MTKHRVYEDGVRRTWTPESRATDEAMNCVLEILLRRGRSLQSDLAEEVAATMDVPIGTARAYVSASLLYFRLAGFVRHVGNEGRTAVWEIDE
jgi:hypothetical protein